MRLRPAASALALALGACSLSAHATPADAVASADTGAHAYEIVKQYAQINGGRHRSASPGSHAVSEWMRDAFASWGLQASIQRYPFNRFDVRRLALRVGDIDLEEIDPDAPTVDGVLKKRPQSIDAYYYSGRTPPEGIHAPLVYGTGAGVRGKIAYTTVTDGLGTSAIRNAMAAAYRNGALAMVLAVQGPRNYVVGQNVDSRAGFCNFPTLIIGAEDGDRLLSMEGEQAHVVLDAVYEDGVEAPKAWLENVVGVIPGASQERVLIGTPKDGLFTTAGERGAGVGIFMSLARLFAERARTETPAKTIVFVATGGHEVYGTGLDYFFGGDGLTTPSTVDKMTSLIASKTTAYLHLGASVATMRFRQAGDDYEPTGETDLPLLFFSENPVIGGVVAHAFGTTGARAAPVPPAAFDPGEQQSAYVLGIPMVGISGSNDFQHTPRDLVDVTAAPVLEPVLHAYGIMTEQLMSIPGEVVRAANAVAAAPPDVNIASAYRSVQACPNA